MSSVFCVWVGTTGGVTGLEREHQAGRGDVTVRHYSSSTALDTIKIQGKAFPSASQELLIRPPTLELLPPTLDFPQALFKSSQSDSKTSSEAYLQSPYQAQRTAGNASGEKRARPTRKASTLQPKKIKSVSTRLAAPMIDQTPEDPASPDLDADDITEPTPSESNGARNGTANKANNGKLKLKDITKDIAFVNTMCIWKANDNPHP
ncbi:hypothetical protein BDZ45DRAFT_743363 [Acephala macrosclerotiorum]|nr:hypothetical protein BDZ45DRAFT_743363 [Acephala macrosclerotiorum]